MAHITWTILTYIAIDSIELAKLKEIYPGTGTCTHTFIVLYRDKTTVNNKQVELPFW